MIDLRTAAQQALDGLCLWATGRDMDAVALNDLILRLEAALAEPQEPMAWTADMMGDKYKQAIGSKNCMQCAAAYMLGLPLAAVPDFEKAGPDAWESFEAFFAALGFTTEMLPPNLELLGDYLASGESERGTSHMVVMRDGKLLHDPHPSNAGLAAIQVVWVIARRAGPGKMVRTLRGSPEGTPLYTSPTQRPAQPVQEFASIPGTNVRVRLPVQEPVQEPDNGGKTGWPQGLLQDDCRGLSKWLASRPDARQRLREALAEQAQDTDCHAQGICQRSGYSLLGQHKPLSEVEIFKAYETGLGKKLPNMGASRAELIALTRIVERAHGIGGES